MAQQDRARVGQRGRPVLALPVGSHDPVEAADAEVVLGRHATGVVERLLTGQHHRAGGGHHQDAAGVHQHGRLGVPVRLGAHVHPGDDDVDLAAALGELDQAAQHRADPVHVLGAAVHRDLGARGQREPFDRHPHPLGQVQRRDDPPALGLGDIAQPAGGVAEQRHPGHALGHLLGVVAQQADDDVGGVAAVRSRHGREVARVFRVVEVVLDELARRGSGPAPRAAG